MGRVLVINDTKSYDYRDRMQPIVKVSLRTGQRQIINPSPFDWPLSLSSSPSPVEPLIAYTSCEFVTEYYRNVDTEIALINWDTLDRHRLTDNNSYEFFPMWSPDGKHIVFFSWRKSGPIFFDVSDNIDINVVNPQGDLTVSGRGALLHPVAWSPNSQEFAFIRDIGIEADAGTHRGEINRIGVFITGIDAIAPKQIASATSYSRVGRFASVVFGGPSWSPDGQEIAFGGSNDDGVSVHLVGRDGTNQRVIWEGESSKPISQVEWSPDGEEILFLADSARVTRVIRPDGGGLRRLTLPPEINAPLRYRTAQVRAAWSPDSSRLAFYNGVNDIIIMNRDGTNARILEVR